MFADEWREDEEAKAKERQSLLNGKTQLPVSLPEAEKGDSRDKVGSKVGVSGSSIDKARTIKETLPSVAEQVRAGLIPSACSSLWQAGPRSVRRIPQSGSRHQ